MYESKVKLYLAYAQCTLPLLSKAIPQIQAKNWFNSFSLRLQWSRVQSILQCRYKLIQNKFAIYFRIRRYTKHTSLWQSVNASILEGCLQLWP